MAGDSLFFDIATLTLSYLFILFAAWNDSLLGLAPNALTIVCEYLLAALLLVEIVLRLIFTANRRWYFYFLIAVDAISILTIIPSLGVVTFARFVRLSVSGARMFHIIDKIARQRANPYVILLVYPIIVPVVAALFFAIERDGAAGHVHDYFQALALIMSYSMTIGIVSNHPVTDPGKVIAGLMLLFGLMCVSVIGNALSNRYSVIRSEDPPLDKTIAGQLRGPRATYRESTSGTPRS